MRCLWSNMYPFSLTTNCCAWMLELKSCCCWRWRYTYAICVSFFSWTSRCQNFLNITHFKSIKISVFSVCMKCTLNSFISHFKVLSWDKFSYCTAQWDDFLFIFYVIALVECWAVYVASIKVSCFIWISRIATDWTKCLVVIICGLFLPGLNFLLLKRILAGRIWMQGVNLSAIISAVVPCSAPLSFVIFLSATIFRSI